MNFTVDENSKVPNNSIFIVTKLSQAQGKLQGPEHRTEGKGTAARPPEQQGDLKISIKSFPFKA